MLKHVKEKQIFVLLILSQEDCLSSCNFHFNPKFPLID